MHLLTFLPTLLFLCASTVLSATIAQLTASTDALTKQADTIDEAVAALTAQSPPAAAQLLPPALASLTTSITNLISTLTNLPPTSDPATAFNVVDTFGLFANTIWELMDDYTYQEDVTGVVGGFEGLKAGLYAELRGFEGAFQDLSDFTTGVLSDPFYKADVGYYTGNTTYTINLALEAYAP